MNATTVSAAKLAIPPDVREFVRERGLEPYFPAIVAILERLFADATKLSVVIHDDPEIANLRWLIFDVDVDWTAMDQVRAAKKAWYQETATVCPSHLINEFSLSIWRP